MGLKEISCSSQIRLQPLQVQTQGTQLLKVFIQFYYINSHQQYENVTTEVSHSSIFKYHNALSVINSYNTHKTQKTKRRQLKDSWGSYTATGSEITEREQLLCNTHLIRVLLKT